MRLDLKINIDQQRKDACARITELADVRQREHAEAGGFTMEHAIYAAGAHDDPDVQAANASLDHHLLVQRARRHYIEVIQDSHHGSAMATAIREFEAELKSARFLGSKTT